MATAEFPTLAPRVELGKKLFFDPRLSADGTVACATCHRRMPLFPSQIRRWRRMRSWK
ncbi:MAG: cytochrome c peroxidase [Gammaproteobacteria bacterium]